MKTLPNHFWFNVIWRSKECDLNNGYFYASSLEEAKKHVSTHYNVLEFLN